MGMSRLNVKMQTTVDRMQLLATLRSNREQHAKIVKEAQEGYLKDAISRANQCLSALTAGKLVSLSKFSTHVPESYASAYDTVISMLEWSTDEKIVLAADEFRQFVQDQWDWKDGFLASNAGYSGTARLLSAGLDPNDY